MGKKCVVTGGAGFVGGFVVEHLAKEDPTNQVLIFDIQRPDYPLYPNVKYMYGDIRNSALLDLAFKDVDEVYDFAGLLGTSELIEMTDSAIETNILGACRVLDAVRREESRRGKYITLDENYKLISEEPASRIKVFHPTKPSFRTGPDRNWENTYTLTKFGAEYLSFMYKEKFGINVSVLRFLNASGPRQHLYPIRKAYPLMIILALNNIDLEIYGDGEQTMDIIDVRDVAEISVMACRDTRLNKVSEALDTGTGISVTVNDLAKMIIEFTGSKSKITYLPMRAGEVKNTNIVANTSNLNEYFPDWSPRYLPEETLKHSIEYYKGLSESEIRNVLQFYGKQVDPSTGL